ncbi:mitochondrial carrier domain-containing protein [Aspergillus stella-maris]|uniref:mitochondrial carrier domain-containing protein n=1 Tax=Aspergillus stella-maris TaxID=1810926 RepID=UPI003CCCC84D
MSEFKTSAPELKAPGMVKEFVVGAAGGATQVLIGQPFDIVKVRMQVQANKSAIQVAQSILRHEGLLAFYKGTLPPLLGVGACISIVYSTFHTISESIKSSTNNPTLSPPQTFLAGGLAGLANSFVSGPTEHIRIRLQTQNQNHPSTNESRPRLRPGVLSTIRYIHARSGWVGLYRGQTPTMLREFGSYGVWFSVYEFLLSHLASPSSDPSSSSHSSSPTKGNRDQIPTYKIASCGIITGLVLWSVNYPFDVVKSKMQADGFESQQRYSNMRDVMRQTWNGHGVMGFYRGLGPTLARAVPVSAGTFVVVEMVRKVL